MEIETLHTILEFTYTGTAKVEESLLSKVALFADQLLLPSVKNQCLAHFAAKVLSPKNAFEFYVLCDSFGHQKLKDAALLKAASNMTCPFRFNRLENAGKWRLLVGWAKVQQACEELSIEAGITTDFDPAKCRDDRQCH
ncbi:hypothetical protein HDU98_009413 [Podochytrium sp. JEL0797]|nr:hypothetical protein HDU98_009413 [Podochytrium sp. JEL0797]